MLLMSTSGTTGSPKFVRLSYSNFQSNTKEIIKYLDIKSKDITITYNKSKEVSQSKEIDNYLKIIADESKIYLEDQSEEEE